MTATHLVSEQLRVHGCTGVRVPKGEEQLEQIVSRAPLGATLGDDGVDHGIQLFDRPAALPQRRSRKPHGQTENLGNVQNTE